ncbi:MAG: hydrogenase formation protein HypD [Elusimicrobiota bacterium]
MSKKKTKIDAFILPGHVSAIIGSKPYKFISEKFNTPAVITGFEPSDILEGIFFILKQIESNKPKIEIQYNRAVQPQGNAFAVKLLYSVFEKTDSQWRGIGIIKNSGLKFTKKYEKFDTLKKFGMKIKKLEEPAGCLCGKVLTGIATPQQCEYFGKNCTPLNPIGPCMVSSEGTCCAYYKYGF